MTKTAGVRPLTDNDLPELLSLERAVWEPKSIETVPEAVAREWISSGILLGFFEERELLGYVYGEVIHFTPLPPYSAELQAAMQDYKTTGQKQGGNALHGVSMVARKPGAGALLLEALVKEARTRCLEYFVSLARLEGLARFVRKHEAVLRGKELLDVATLYALQAVSLVNSELIGPPLSLLALPDDFPQTRRKDLAVSRFARLGKELWGVGETSFDDPESLGYSALLVLTL